MATALPASFQQSLRAERGRTWVVFALAIWDRVRDEPFVLPPDKPLTLATYAAGTEVVAYVEPVAVGDALPEMALFLAADQYVPCPLEVSYQTAWEQFPAPLKAPLE